MPTRIKKNYTCGCPIGKDLFVITPLSTSQISILVFSKPKPQFLHIHFRRAKVTGILVCACYNVFGCMVESLKHDLEEGDVVLQLFQLGNALEQKW